MDCLLTRCKPKHIDDFIGNDKAKQAVSSWLDDFQARRAGTMKAVLITGPTGCGKTTFARLAVSAKMLTAFECTAADVRSQKSLHEKLDKVLNEQNVAVALQGDSGGEHQTECGQVVIMDDTESMQLIDKGGFVELMHTINPLRGRRNIRKIDREWQQGIWTAEAASQLPSVPVICICGDMSDRKAADLKRDCLHIPLEALNEDEFTRWMVGLAAQENIEGSDYLLSQEVLGKTWQCCRGDNRRALLMVDDIVTGGDPSVLLNNFRKPGGTSDIFEATEKILGGRMHGPEVYSLFENDKMLLPLMIHENYGKAVAARDGTRDQQSMACFAISRSLSQADVIDKCVYATQTWALQELSGMLSIVLPNYSIGLLQKPDGLVSKRHQS